MTGQGPLVISTVRQFATDGGSRLFSSGGGTVGAPLIVGFDAATIVNRVYRIARAVVNYVDPEMVAERDTFLMSRLPDVD